MVVGVGVGDGRCFRMGAEISPGLYGGLALAVVVRRVGEMNGVGGFWWWW